MDTLRSFYPEKRDIYTWWDFKTRARERNIGWRIDYFFIHRTIQSSLKNAYTLPDVMGSDHCPIGITIAL